MAEMTDAQFRQKVIDVLDEKGASVDTDIEQVTEIDDKVTLPGIRTDSQGNFVSYCLAKMTVFHTYVKNATDAIVATWNRWFGSDDTSGVQKQWKDLKTDAVAATNAANTAAQSVDAAIATAEADHTRAESDHSTASSDHSTAQGDHTTAGSDHTQASTDHSTASADHTQANADHTRAEGDHSTASSDHTIANSDHTTAGADHTQAGADHNRAETDHTKVAGAENLDAQLVGYTVSITNRQGVTTSVDVGFDIYKTYTSVSAMNADAANVPQGKFVVIATTSATDPDNAKMYCKNSQGSFTFLCDLDQASSAAWADWLNNMKPLIEADHTTAQSDHTTATTDHNTATTDHSTATSDHTQAQSDSSRAGTDHTRAESDHTTASTDHAQAGTDHTTASSDHTRAENDHTQATTDSGVASSDHTRAESDHSTASTDHTTAQSDHTTASTDHTRADGDHSTASDDHTQAGTDHTAAVSATQYANEQGDYAKAWNDHPPYIGDGTTGDLNYWYLYDITTERYVKSLYAKGDNLEWEDITPAEKQRLIDEMLQTLENEGFDAVPTENSTKPVTSNGIWTALQLKMDKSNVATVQTCEDIIDELI